MAIDIEQLLSAIGPEIEKEIECAIPRTGVPNLHDAVWYHLGTGGKRVRPALAVGTCTALGGKKKTVMPFAAACELLHNWFLVHDDIEDGDVVRRGKDAVWKRYGLAHGINVGDFMSEKVYALVLRSVQAGLDTERTLRLAAAVAETCAKTAEGQAMDINLSHDDTVTEEQYMETVGKKTAWYLTLPIVGGAIAAGASQSMLDMIRRFGLCIGPAFQIADDVLDLTHGKGREETGCDIKEGKRSIMVVHCSRLCTPDEKKQLFTILNAPREHTSHDDICRVKTLFETCGSIDYARKRASELVDEGKNISRTFPSPLREVLDSFADYIIVRKR